MKERPIIFSAAMVKAILEDRKTQTRRIIKKEYQRHYSDCPYGKAGDRLWVREAWKIIGWNEGYPFTIQYKDGKQKYDVYLPEEKAEDYWIQCTDDCIKAGIKSNEEGMFVIDGEVPTRWRPSIFMPREASRINLEITNTRMERLNDLNEIDAKQEGVSLEINNEKVYSNYKSAFVRLWCKIHKSEDAWFDNPYVWVIEFKKI